MGESETAHEDEEEEGKKPGKKGLDIETWVEILSAVLLSMALIASAWCAYQSARWNGVQSIEFGEAAANRNKSIIYSSSADNALEIDTTALLDYTMMQMLADISEEELEDFRNKFFSDRLKVALQAWLKTNPDENLNAPESPFVMDEYINTYDFLAKLHFQRAEEDSQAAKDANQQSDNYVLLTVLFATVLFFAGISTKFKDDWVKIAALAFGGLIFYGTLMSLFFQSVH
jgi:hypothetical protein